MTKKDAAGEDPSPARSPASGEPVQGEDAGLRARLEQAQKRLAEAEEILKGTDATERARAETALRESEQRLRLALEAASTGMWDRDTRSGSQELLSSVFSGIEAAITVSEVLDEGRDFRFIAANRACAEWSGIAAEDWLGKRPGDLFPPHHAEHIRNRYREAFQRQKPVRYEETLSFPNGQVSSLTTVSPLPDAAGNIRRVVATSVDISELKLAEERLRQTHQRLEYHVQNTPLAVVEFDADLRVCAWSDGARRIFGWDPAEVLGRPMWDIPWLLESDREKVAAISSGLAAGQTLRNFSLNRNLRKDGAVIWCEWHNSSLTDDAGKMQSILSLVLDVTQREDATEALRQSEERFRAMFDGHRAVKLVIEPETGAIVDANAAAVEFYGYPREQLRAMRIDQINQLAREEVAAERRLALAQKRRYFEFPHRLANGEVRWVQVYSTPVPIQGRTLLYSIIHDATDRKKAQEDLRAAHERLRLAKSAARLGIHDYNPLTGEVYWDERVRQLWELTPDEPVTFDVFLSRIHPHDRAATRAAIDRALDPAGNGVYCAEFRLAHPRRTLWVAAAGQVFFENGRAVRLVGTVQDITDRKEFQAELERLVAERTAKLQELVSELEHFSYTITHDMRAPLRAMQGFAEVFVDACAEGREQDAQRFLDRIRTAANRMDALIRDALSYNEAIRKHLPLSPVDVSQLLRGMIDTYPEFQADRARIRVQDDIPPVFANEAGLTQVFSNLLNNAIKFAKPGHPADIRVWAEPVHRPPEAAPDPAAAPKPAPSGGFAPIPSQPVAAGGQSSHWVRIWVEDQGIGISSQMLPRVFNMFSRGTSDRSGTGIGLALVRKVVDRLGGRVGVESQEGQGSRFWVELTSAD